MLQNPNRGNVEMLIEYLGEKLQDDYEAMEDQWAIDLDEFEGDAEEATAHLSPNERALYMNELMGLRNVAKTYDWLVKFMSAEMDETGAFDNIPSVEDWAPGEITETFGK